MAVWLKRGIGFLAGTALLVLGLGLTASSNEGCCSISADQSVETVPYSIFATTPGAIWSQIDVLGYWAVPRNPPSGYYQDVDATESDALRDSLHVLIDGHTTQPYGESESDGTWPAPHDSNVDVWDILALADAYPLDPSKVLGLYSNAVFARQSKGAVSGYIYDREHSWPKSYGFNEEDVDNPAYSDCHHLFPALKAFNSSRGQCPYGSVVAEIAVGRDTVPNLLCAGGPSITNQRFSRSIGENKWCLWETWCARRGDVARAMFYMAIRYEGPANCGDCKDNEVQEPNLELTDDLRLIATCNDAWLGGCSAFMGLLSDLLKWHLEDPVDDFERRRNTIVYLFQGNRNPFVDHPEWVEELFGA